MSHMKTCTFRKKGIEYELEIDAEDPENLVIETVTQLSGKPEFDIDAEIFQEDLDADDWASIREKLS